MAVPSIQAPNLSPSLLQGYWSRPEWRGQSAETLNAQMPRFGSWEEALANLPNDPRYRALSQGRDSDAYRTMFLQNAYGLPQDYGVQGGRIVSTNHSVRNGLLGGAALLGGLTGLDALIGGGTAAATGTTGATATGATLPASTVPGWSTVGMAGGATVPPALSGAAAAAGLGTTAANTATRGVGQDILDSIRGRDGAQALATLIPMLMAARVQGQSPLAGGPTMDTVNKLIGMSTERAQRTDPLHQAVTQLAMSRLPTGVQR